MRLDDYIVNFVHTFTVSVCMLNFMFCTFLISILLSVPDPLSEAEEDTLPHWFIFVHGLFLYTCSTSCLPDRKFWFGYIICLYSYIYCHA